MRQISSTSSFDTRSYGAWLIGLGLVIVVAAQFVAGIPVAAAMAMIGWGAIAMMRSEIAALVNLAVYAVLVGYTIGSQSHAAAMSVSGRVDHLTSIDHLIALTLLAALTWLTLRRAAEAFR